MVSGQLEVCFLGRSMPWFFLGFPKYSLVGTALLVTIGDLAMPLLDVFTYEECMGYPKIFYIPDRSPNGFLGANIEGKKKNSASVLLCFAP